MLEDIKAIIVDDEKPARQELFFLLNKIDSIKIIGECTSAKEAIELAKKEEVNVAFLDISMPGMNGIDLAIELQKISNNNSLIVFITAFNEYAISAFEANAIDYILKPFDEERLQKTINKIMKHFENRNNNQEITKNEIAESSVFNISNLIKDKLVAEKGDKVILIDVNNIIYTYTEEGITYIKTFDTQYLTKYNLSQLEKKLTAMSFFRAHRSYLVNFNHVIEIIPFFNGTYMLLVNDKDKTKIPVSRIQAKKLRQIFDI